MDASPSHIAVQIQSRVNSGISLAPNLEANLYRYTKIIL